MIKVIDKSTKKLMSEFAGFYVRYNAKIEEERVDDIFVPRASVDDALEMFLEEKEKNKNGDRKV